jgi:hypothetical protein
MAVAFPAVTAPRQLLGSACFNQGSVLLPEESRKRTALVDELLPMEAAHLANCWGSAGADAC